MYENLPITWTAGEGGGDLARVDLVDALQRGAAGVQDAVAVAGFQQLLPVDAAHEPHGQAATGSTQDRQHRDPSLQDVKNGVLLLESGERAGPLIALHDRRTVSERAIGIAVPQRRGLGCSAHLDTAGDEGNIDAADGDQRWVRRQRPRHGCAHRYV